MLADDNWIENENKQIQSALYSPDYAISAVQREDSDQSDVPAHSDHGYSDIV